MVVNTQEAFTAARTLLSTVRDLAFYDPKRPTSLHVDASRLNGLGFLLKQLDDSKVWRVVQAGSRFLSSAESRYAMIELECLSAAWATNKCRQFLERLSSFELVTDHKPLLPILNSYSLDKLDDPFASFTTQDATLFLCFSLGARKAEFRRLCPLASAGRSSHH